MDPVGPQARFALYYAPPAGSVLEDLARRWLGRDVTTGERVERPAVAGIDPARAESLTESPRFYGFHGTLKAPFALAEGCRAEDLMAAVEAFSAARAPFSLPPLVVAPLGGFIALVPSAPSAMLDDLAAHCVQVFDAFRAPPSAADLEKRRAAGLTAGQQALLERWGYPYVMEAFRFHMTLTGRLDDDGERAATVAALRALFASVTAESLPVDGLSVFFQPDRTTPFRLLRRVPFAASGGA